jgi:hypothetical protein
MLIGEITASVKCPAEDWRNGPGKIGPLREKMDALNVGESFTVSISPEENIVKARDRISSCRTHLMKVKKCKFLLRKTADLEFTVWRVK